MKSISPKMARQIFGEALEMRPEERTRFLESACGGDTALRGRVEALLVAYDDADGFLVSREKGSSEVHLPSSSAAKAGTLGSKWCSHEDDARTLHDCDRIADAPGTQIGRYKL